MNKESN